mmetsp:Transcript_93519/g.264067  ORF Transcript_93519/g.264067 Transcript_93519/m.264067 type:complete len:332 (-) Transcript_93519:32-1027(-)
MRVLFPWAAVLDEKHRLELLEHPGRPPDNGELHGLGVDFHEVEARNRQQVQRHDLVFVPLCRWPFDILRHIVDLKRVETHRAEVKEVVHTKSKVGPAHEHPAELVGHDCLSHFDVLQGIQPHVRRQGRERWVEGLECDDAPRVAHECSERQGQRPHVCADLDRDLPCFDEPPPDVHLPLAPFAVDLETTSDVPVQRVVHHQPMPATPHSVKGTLAALVAASGVNVLPIAGEARLHLAMVLRARTVEPFVNVADAKLKSSKLLVAQRASSLPAASISHGKQRQTHQPSSPRCHMAPSASLRQSFSTRLHRTLALPGIQRSGPASETCDEQGS